MSKFEFFMLNPTFLDPLPDFLNTQPIHNERIFTKVAYYFSPQCIEVCNHFFNWFTYRLIKETNVSA